MGTMTEAICFFLLLVLLDVQFVLRTGASLVFLHDWWVVVNLQLARGWRQASWSSTAAAAVLCMV